ncbi:MAG: hypothetical protein JO108_30085 [Acidobacteriaceae bacterium]|nr:hypothetical protein [Acidobacteriaceae bacterium]
MLRFIKSLTISSWLLLTFSAVSPALPAGYITTIANRTSQSLGSWTPVGVAMAPNGSTAYVADITGNAVWAINVSNGQATRFAGTGTGGYSGDGGPATSATLTGPRGLAVDGSGNVLICDAGNNVIREVKISSGVITTVAGTASSSGGFSGDGGPAVNAQLKGPYGIVVNASGDLFISDTGNARIRKVGNVGGQLTSASVITTYAGTGQVGFAGDGGAAAAAQFNQPIGLAVDSAGNLYIADELNYVVREITASSGNINTVAGNHTPGYSGDGGPATSASLFDPLGLAVDSHGDIYVSEIGNNTLVRRITGDTHIISPFAGQYNKLGYSGDGGPATSAALNQPTFIALDQFGNLFINDSINYAIREVFSATNGLLFVPVSPCRVVDTRNANGTFGGPFLSGQVSRDFPIPSSSCNIPASAQAYSLNVTVVPKIGLGYLTVWPTGQAQPTVSTTNSLDGRTKANAAIVPAGANGSISAFASNDSDLVLDIDGYFIAANAQNSSSALAFFPLTPCRIADTRTSNGPLGGPFIPGQGTRTFTIPGTCNVPTSAQAFSLNMTVVPKVGLGYLTVWPAGQSQPFVSTLNAPTGTTTANGAIVPAGANGAINVFASNDTDLVIDINGYFGPQGNGGLSLYNVTPCRVIDTRNAPGPYSGQFDVNVQGSSCAPPSVAESYVLNATVVPNGGGLGYLTLWAQLGAQPTVSTLNALDGTVTSNLAIVPTTNGSISTYASTQQTTYLVLDLFGYFAQ